MWSVLVVLLTGTLDEGPVVASVGRAEALIQHHVPVSESVPVSGAGPGAGGLQGASVGALHADAFAGVTGITAPAALGPLQTVGTRPQTRTVLGCRKDKRQVRSV